VSGNFTQERAVFPPTCGPLDSAPNVVLAWQAPHDGDFFATTAGTPASVTSWNGGCASDISGFSCGTTEDGLAFSFKEGDAVTFVLTPTVEPWGAYSFGITDQNPACEGGICPPSDTGNPPGGPVSDAAAASAAEALCLDNAHARHDDMCAGVQCACAHCPQDYDDCHVVPGCGAITDCMTEKHCVGADCYISGQCRSTVDTYGGLSGPAFRAASGLQSCSLSVGCGLPCADGGYAAKPATDAGVLDAGPVCAAGRTVECPCEGGVTGTKQCLPDGSGFRACVCGEPPLTPISSEGCKCRVGAATSQGGGAAGALAMLALALLRRRARRSAGGT
jgi:MYXO-CTERM domain-containing protein